MKFGKRGRHVTSLSKQVVKWLKLYSKKIEIVGSIRRKEKNSKDIDIVIIPKSQNHKKKIYDLLKSKGRFIQGGEKRMTFRIRGVKTELYFTTPESWGATLLAYSSKRGASIGLRVIARAKGFKLNQYGLFKGGKYIAGETEKDIYSALGRPWKKPEKR